MSFKMLPLTKYSKVPCTCHWCLLLRKYPLCLSPMDPSIYLLRKCVGNNLLSFGGLTTSSDSVWIHREVEAHHHKE